MGLYKLEQTALPHNQGLKVARYWQGLDLGNLSAVSLHLETPTYTASITSPSGLPDLI
jgi:hypothetical protein